MLRTIFASLLIAALAAFAAGQDSQPAHAASQPAAAPSAANQTPPANQMPSGTVIVAELSKSVNAKKVKPGDKIEARTSMDLLSQGKIVIPRNTKIIGHVTEAKAHSKESHGSMIGIAFDRIAMKDGRELQMQASIQAIARPLQSAALIEGSPMSDNSGMPSSAPSPSSGGMGGVGSRSPSSSYPGPPSPASTDDTAPAGGPAPLGPTSKGVVGMKGLELQSTELASVISSEKNNVQLDSGTQLILRTQ